MWWDALGVYFCRLLRTNRAVGFKVMEFFGLMDCLFLPVGVLMNMKVGMDVE